MMLFVVVFCCVEWCCAVFVMHGVVVLCLVALCCAVLSGAVLLLSS
jgi:hypothetical protein